MSDTPNALDRATFVSRFGGVYEHSPWIAERAFDAGLHENTATVDDFAQALVAVVEAADHEARLTLLRAHPDLAGKLAIQGALTTHSRNEQAGAALDACSAEEFDRFQELNETYKTRFGFPFILAVRGYHRRQILEIFEQRVGNDPETEFRTALDQVHRIARLRLNDLM